MSVEEEIIDYFTRRIEENMEQILKAFRFFLNDELYQKLVDKIDNANSQSKSNGEKYVINENLEQKYKDHINSHEGAFFGIFNEQNTLYSMVKIYDGTLMYTIDFDLIQCYLNIILRRDTDYRLPNIDLTDPFEKETYRILKELVL